MIVLDTSVLVDGLTGPLRSGAALRRAIEHGERLALPALVLYEWLRGPRSEQELEVQEALFPSEAALAFGWAEVKIAVGLYATVPKPRGREVDLAIAAHGIARHARLWTLNTADFEDIPGLDVIATFPAPA